MLDRLGTKFQFVTRDDFKNEEWVTSDLLPVCKKMDKSAPSELVDQTFILMNEGTNVPGKL